MKFKSAEADWNISVVSQHVDDRNSRAAVARKLYRLGAMGWVYWTGNGCRKPVRERTSMKTYLKFAASFWMSAFLITGSMAMAQTTSTTKAKKKNGSSTTSTAPAATTTSSAQTQSGTTTASTTSSDSTTQTAPAAHDQQSGTTAPAMKAITGPDKHTIWVPQL
jgi:hypothetical protein